MAKTPVDDFFEHKTKEAAAKAEEDLNLWKAWDSGGRNAQTLKPLMQRYEPLFNRKLKEWKAPAVNQSAFKAELQKQFINAANSFNPSMGVAFNTHIQNRLQKAKRYNIKHQNVGYIPEAKVKHIGGIQIARNQLQEELGRAPTIDEISVHTGLPAKQVSGIEKSMRRDIPASAFETDPIGISSEREQDIIRTMGRKPEDYFSPEETNVFKHIYGVGAAKMTSTNQLAKQLKMSPSRISRLKTSIGNKIKSSI